MKPLAHNRAFNRTILPTAFFLCLKTHLQLRISRFRGRLTRIQLPFLMRALNSVIMAFSHDPSFRSRWIVCCLLIRLGFSFVVRVEDFCNHCSFATWFVEVFIRKSNRCYDAFVRSGRGSLPLLACRRDCGLWRNYRRWNYRGFFVI